MHRVTICINCFDRSNSINGKPIGRYLTVSHCHVRVLCYLYERYASMVHMDCIFESCYVCAMEAILSNELFNLKLDCHESIIPRGEYYDNISFSHKACAWQGATLGNDYVRGRDYLKSGLKYTYHHVWRNFGIIIGFLCFFLFCSLLAAEYITPLFTRENLLRWNNYLKRYCPF